MVFLFNMHGSKALAEEVRAVEWEATAGAGAGADAVTAAGVWVLLVGFVVGIAFNSGLGSGGEGIGYRSCAWRVSYSPTGKAFRIWGLIYTWMFVSIVTQLVDGSAKVQANYLMGAAWLVVGMWGPTFTRGSEGDRPAFIAAAACVLVAAAVLAGAAVGVEQSWRSRDARRVLVVGVPYSLTAGWLAVAAVLNVGIAYAAATEPPDPRCKDADRRRDWEQTPLSAASASAPSSWVQLAVALATSAGAFLLPDPVLVLPAINGVFFARAHFKRLVALEVLVVTGVAAAIQVALGKWAIG